MSTVSAASRPSISSYQAAPVADHGMRWRRFVRVLAIILGAATAYISFRNDCDAAELSQICAAPATSIEISHTHNDVQVATDFTSKEILSFAKQQAVNLTYAPVGYYRSSVAFKIKIYNIQGEIRGCPQKLGVAFDLALVNRKIEISRDLVSRKCRYDEALRHYELHAARDEEAFDQFILSSSSQLQAAVEKATAEAAANRNEQVDQLKANINAALQTFLNSLDDAKNAAQAAVDTADELRRLEEGSCVA